MVEHSTADREVPGSIPGAPFFSLILLFLNMLSFLNFVILKTCYYKFHVKTIGVLRPP